MLVESRVPRLKPIAWCLSAIISAFVCVGCERQPTTVTGAVTLDHDSVHIAPDMRGTISFQPQTGQGAVATGLLNPTGNYELSAGASSEIPPGKYQVAISIVKLVPKPEGGEQGAKQVTAQKFASAATSGLAAEVQRGPNELNFDVSSSDSAERVPDAAPPSAPEKSDASKGEKK
jgi:hypothetical protein